MADPPAGFIPEGLRVYAIGDIHGRLDLLIEMHDRIKADRLARPSDHIRIIHLGDYIDRGPDSAGVVEFLSGLIDAGEAVCLAGNHDLWLPAFLKDPASVGEQWLRYGGVEALLSWGLDTLSANFANRPWSYVRDAFISLLPAHHRAFFGALPFMERQGGYYFTHAGVRPNVPLTKQRIADLTMIREPFLSATDNFGAIIVHGHTITPEPVFRPNRIGIDTGAWRSGILTCLVLEGSECGLLYPGGYRPVVRQAVTR